MINALFLSRSGGTKLFQCRHETSTFGWGTIIEMYKREVSRAKQQQTHMVPRLKEIHIVRDSWTKLNVSPAKIMQVCSILLFINIFVFTARASIDGAILAHTSRSTTCWRWCDCWGSQVFRGMQFAFQEGISEPWEGFLHGFNNPAEYFKWLPVFHVMALNTVVWRYLVVLLFFSVVTGMFLYGQFPHTSSTQKAFLSWKSKWAVLTFYLYLGYIAWDLLRIDVYGFWGFCTYFFQKYPGYFVSPLRISGSAVESLFSQFKHNARGKLDSCNYLRQGVHTWSNKVQLTITAVLGTVTRHLAIWSYPFKRRNMQPNNTNVFNNCNFF